MLCSLKGKILVARLFARTLCDSGLRQSNTFVETSGQDLKEAGVDKFKQKANAAIGGCLFMDEGKSAVFRLMLISHTHISHVSVVRFLLTKHILSIQ